MARGGMLEPQKCQTAPKLRRQPWKSRPNWPRQGNTKSHNANRRIMMSDIRLAIAPIGWTNDDLPELGGNIPFEQCVSEMALAGFKGSEVGNKYPKDPAVLNKA